MSQPLVLHLNSAQATLATAGGKGVNLARLAAAGLPVPGGFVVTTAAYHRFVAENALQGRILDLARRADVNDPAALEAASQAIRRHFAAGSVPSDLAWLLTSAYANLGSRSVAVRSSATAEDLPDMSFAGQQDTFLNVVGDSALLEAVVRCWSSLWTARAIAYRSRNGIPHDDVALAVIVQAMVESEASGVLFTANPLTGKRTEAVIDATLGLGEALVGGHVEPDNYVVDTAHVGILAKALGSKGVAIRGQAGGGTVVVETDAARRQALSDAAILELARLGQRVQDELYGGQPQDIEWAWADGGLHLLQSRAITSLYPLPEGMPFEPLQTMFSVNHVQGMLDPISPMGRDVFTMVLLSLISVVHHRFDPATQRELQVAGERLYANFTPALRHGWSRRVILAAFGFIEPSTRQAVTTLLDDPRLATVGGRPGLKSIARFLRRAVPILGNIARVVRHPDARRTAMMQVTEREIALMQREMAEASSLTQRLSLLDVFMARFARVIAPQMLPNLVAGLGSFMQLRRLTVKHLGSEQPALQAARGLPNNVTTEMDLALWEVARTVKADPPSAASLADGEPAALAQDFLNGRLPGVAQAAIADFLARYGMRGVAEIDVGRRRWREDPTHIMQVLQSYMQIDDPALAPDAVFEQGAKAAEATIEEIVRAIDSPLDARLARLFGSRARALAGLREYPKFTMIRVFGIFREGLLQSGRALTTAGVLARPDDIFFLSFQEAKALANEMEDGGSAGWQERWQAVIAGHRQDYQRELRRRQVPRLLLSDGIAFYEGLGRDAQEADGAITGSPVSPGVVEGAVRVVFNPHEAQLAPGDILVCPGTDPAWTPLFLAAGGLVMEVGGLMTHGSVVAREYGIPAVVGVHEATKRLRTGQRVRVDGTAGRVIVLDGSSVDS